MSLSNKFSTNLLSILVFLIVPISGLSIDILSPSLPAMSDYFAVTKSWIQVIVPAYLCGYGLFQLVAGPIADCFGRRFLILVGMLLYTIITFLITFVHVIEMLILLRFLQGTCVAFFVVAMRAVLSDCFSGKSFISKINWLTIIWALGPIIAPFIGGYLQHYLSWKASFYAMSGYSLLLCMACFVLLPETIKPKLSFSLPKLFEIYYRTLSYRPFLAGLVCVGFLYANLLIFCMVSPFLFHIHGYSAVFSGQLLLLMGLSWFLGNIFNRFLLNIKTHKKVVVCLLITFLISTVMAVYCFFMPFSVLSLLLFSGMLIFVGGIAFPNFYANNIIIVPSSPAIANALMGAFMVLLTGLITAIISYLSVKTAFMLSIIFCFTSFVNFLMSLVKI